MEHTKISSIIIGDFTEIKSISDKCFGSDYLTVNQLSNTLNHKGVYIKITSKNTIIGFCLAQIANAFEINTYFKINESDKYKYGIIKTIAIDPDFQRKGFGTALLKHVINAFESFNYISSVYYPSWVESECGGFSKILKKEGFNEVSLYEKYWSDESMMQNFVCVKCGNPPCECSMQLYKQNLNASNNFPH